MQKSCWKRSLTGRVRALLAASSMVVLGACASGAGGAKSEGSPKPAVPVRIATVEQEDVPVQLHEFGTVEAYTTVSVRSQIVGQVAQVHFKEGQEVKKGDLLFSIDPRPFEARLRQAQAALVKDRVQAKNAKVEADRSTHLFKQGFVSKDEYDSSQTQAASLEATVRADEAAVENAKLLLQYCYIRSPIVGRIGQILSHEGNVVKINDTEMAVINQLRPVYVDFSVVEQQLAEVRRRQGAGNLEVEAWMGGKKIGTGELAFIDNKVDSTTGTILLKGLFPNADEALWPGQFVDVNLVLSIQRGAVLVPSEAVETGQNGKYVYVVGDQMKAELRPVSVGAEYAHRLVVTEGLKPGERVVTDGQVRLAPGMTVEARESEPANASPKMTPAAG